MKWFLLDVMLTQPARMRTSGCPIRTTGPIRPSAFASSRNPASTKTSQPDRGAARIAGRERKSGEEKEC
jgi:hypothetical protein